MGLLGPKYPVRSFLALPPPCRARTGGCFYGSRNARILKLCPKYGNKNEEKLFSIRQNKGRKWRYVFRVRRFGSMHIRWPRYSVSIEQVLYATLLISMELRN